VKPVTTAERNDMSDKLRKHGVVYRQAKHAALVHGLANTPWRQAAPCFVSSTGMAMVRACSMAMVMRAPHPLPAYSA
jgi:hypothetical protein